MGVEEEEGQLLSCSQDSPQKTRSEEAALPTIKGKIRYIALISKARDIKASLFIHETLCATNDSINQVKIVRTGRLGGGGEATRAIGGGGAALLFVVGGGGDAGVLSTVGAGGGGTSLGGGGTSAGGGGH